MQKHQMKKRVANKTGLSIVYIPTLNTHLELDINSGRQTHVKRKQKIRFNIMYVHVLLLLPGETLPFARKHEHVEGGRKANNNKPRVKLGQPVPGRPDMGTEARAKGSSFSFSRQNHHQMKRGEYRGCWFLTTNEADNLVDDIAVLSENVAQGLFGEE